MKKIIFIFVILPFLLHCGAEQEDVERIMEDGVEVVINHLEPYNIKGEPSILNLEEEFTIDTERKEIVEVGLTDIGSFDVDSEGSIYFFQEHENDVNLAYKFDDKGNFVTSFGKRGQGPDELEIPIFTNVNDRDEILVKDYNRARLFVFDKNGNLDKIIRLGTEYGSNRVFYPLENSSYLSYNLELDSENRHLYDVVQLYNSEFEILKELDRCDYGPIFSETPKIEGTPRVFICQISRGMIYVGHENRGYEILVYDFEGSLVKKIRKEYIPADVPDGFKENWFVNIGRWKSRLYFPKKMPPFHYFFLDDEGRLFVKTYEKGVKQNEYMHDIFKSDGIFIARASMAGYGRWIYPDVSLDRAKAKSNRFYCIREKESGYKELAVFRMKWE